MQLLYIAPLLLSVLAGAVLALDILRRPLTPSSRPLLVLIFAAAAWSFAYALEFMCPAFACKLFWARLQYAGIVTIPLAWLVFAFRYIPDRRWLEPPLRWRFALALIPLVTFGLVLTNEAHHLIWQEVRLVTYGGVQMLDFDHGPGFWIFFLYSYALILVGTARLLLGFHGAFLRHRRQIVLLLLAALFPWLGNLLYISGRSPLPHLDWTPFAFTLAALLFTIGLFHLRLVDILPIAQQAVFAGLPDCLIVLDARDCLVDLNPAARERMAGEIPPAPGLPVTALNPELAEWVACFEVHETARVEMTTGTEPDLHYYDLRIAPLYAGHPEPVGRLVYCHEITEHKQYQDALERSRSRLEEAVAARTAELNHALDQVQKELAQRTLAEQRTAGVIDLGPDAMVLIDQNSIIQRYNAQAEKLFGLPHQQILGQPLEHLIAPHTSPALHAALKEFIASAHTRQDHFPAPLTARRRDGSPFPVEISLGRLTTPGGFWVACSLRDISERIRSEQEQHKLLDRLSRSHEQLRLLASRLQDVQEYERRQLAGELHDRVGQNLTALNLNLQLIQNLLGEDASPPAVTRLADSLKLVEETTRIVRDVMAELHPLMLEEHGLAAALRWYAGLFTQRTAITVRVVGDEFKPRFPRKEEIILFRLVLEALTNIAKHARATQVLISLTSTGGMSILLVKDNGQGFEIQEESSSGLGLLTMQQRADSIGVRLAIDSTPGEGTTISMIHVRGFDHDASYSDR